MTSIPFSREEKGVAALRKAPAGATVAQSSNRAGTSGARLHTAQPWHPFIKTETDLAAAGLATGKLSSGKDPYEAFEFQKRHRP
jgi:hypothetical protein